MYGMNGFPDDSNEYVMVQVTPLPSGEVTPLQSYNGTPLASANVTPLPIKKWPRSNDSDTGTDIVPICRICHLPGDKEDPLFKPCRCSGTLRFIHYGCLMVGADIFCYILKTSIFTFFIGTTWFHAQNSLVHETFSSIMW